MKITLPPSQEIWEQAQQAVSDSNNEISSVCYLSTYLGKIFGVQGFWTTVSGIITLNGVNICPPSVGAAKVINMFDQGNNQVPEIPLVLDLLDDAMSEILHGHCDYRFSA